MIENEFVFQNIGLDEVFYIHTWPFLTDDGEDTEFFTATCEGYPDMTALSAAQAVGAMCAFILSPETTH